LIVAPDIVGLSPETEVARTNIQRMESCTLAIRTVDRTTDLVRIIVSWLIFPVMSDKRQHVRRQFVQACLLLVRKVGKHVMTVRTVLKHGCTPGRTMRKFFYLNRLTHDQAV